MTFSISRVRTYCPSCQVEPKCPWMIHRSRFPAMAAPIFDRTLGSAIQQSRILIPWASQQSMTAFTSSALWRSSHSAPRPISLTFSPVFPSSLYRTAFSSLLMELHDRGACFRLRPPAHCPCPFRIMSATLYHHHPQDGQAPHHRQGENRLCAGCALGTSLSPIVKLYKKH